MTKKEAGIHKKRTMTKSELEEALINNFTNLQKVLTNLALKFDDLATNMSKMLQLFEISAKSFAEKYTPETSRESDKEFLTKLDSLLDQNKTIAKGIMMMEEKIRHRGPANSMTPNLIQNIPKREQYESEMLMEPLRESPLMPREISSYEDTGENKFRGMTKSRPLPRY